MSTEDNDVGYKRPPVGSRFQPGQSGNPRGRPKKQSAFLEDAAAILSAPVTGQANGKEITVPALQAIFRRLCRNALKGDNTALRRVIDLVLTLEPAVQQKAEHDAKAGFDAKRRLAQLLGIDLDSIDDAPRKPTPEDVKLQKKVDALAREERKRLIREAKRHRQNQY